MAVSVSTRVVNAAGLHARPCHAVVTLALEFASEIRIGKDAQRVNAKSIIELMSLGAPCGTELFVEAEGEDAEAAVAAIKGLVDSGFGE